MDNETKERIIQFNRRFGLNTEFITDENILGYALGNTIYINSSIEQDYERTNRHELLHFFEETPEFEDIKMELFEAQGENLKQIRKEYKLRYLGLYSDEEIELGVLDNEIAIDLMVSNSSIEYEEGLKVGDRFLGNIEHGLEEKRYLNLSINRNIQNMNLSKWEKIFVANFYDGKEHIQPQADKSIGIKREDIIRQDIEAYLEQLYSMREEEFKIDPHSIEIIREYESEIKALQARGENTDYLERNRERALQELAKKYSEQLYAEYKHIVDLIKGEEYEPAFKCMMLRETLTKTYKLDTEKENGEDKTKTIVKKRKPHESIAGHMVLNETTLDFIYKHAEDMEQYQNFANLYFASVEIFKQTIAKHSGITIEGVETYGKGQWIKFDGKNTDEEQYLENAKKLAALVQDTPWCTKTLASTQLAEGDFYVFLDNEGKPHVAVRMTGNQIGEVRGLLNGNAQELEEEYRDVAISFLTENKEIKNGKEWLEKEEWNKRLIEYKRKIDTGEFAIEDVPTFIEDYLRRDFKSNGGENTNKTALKERLEKIKGIIAKYYECIEAEICIGDIDFHKTDFKVVPYKVIFGNAYFGLSNIQNLGQLQSIGGDAFFGSSQVKDLGQLRSIGEVAYFRNSQVESLGQLQSIGGDAFFEDSQVESLGQLRSIGGDAFFSFSQVKDLGQLRSIGEVADFKFSPLKDLGELQSIGGDADFEYSQVESLGQLRSIGGDAYFRFSQVKDLGQLQNIGECAFFESSKVRNLGQLRSIGLEEYTKWGDRIDLKEQYEERKQEKEAIKLTGQDIGKAGFGTSVEECDNANDFLSEQLAKTDEREDT